MNDETIKALFERAHKPLEDAHYLHFERKSTSQQFPERITPCTMPQKLVYCQLTRL